jgi:glycerol-3-phosphate acyltransferase PlsY
VIVGLMPLVAAVLLPAWFAIVAVTRYTSVGSIVAAVAATPLAWLFDYDWPYVALAGAMSLAVLAKHRSNLVRLVQRRENRIELRRAHGT